LTLRGGWSEGQFQRKKGKTQLEFSEGGSELFTKKKTCGAGKNRFLGPRASAVWVYVDKKGGTTEEKTIPACPLLKIHELGRGNRNRCKILEVICSTKKEKWCSQTTGLLCGIQEEGEMNCGGKRECREERAFGAANLENFRPIDVLKRGVRGTRRDGGTTPLSRLKRGKSDPRTKRGDCLLWG